MAMDAQEIENHLRVAFPDAEIVLQDLKGDQEYFSLEVVSMQFKGLSRIQQHKQVYTALKGHAGTAIHALTIKTTIPGKKSPLL